MSTAAGFAQGAGAGGGATTEAAGDGAGSATVTYGFERPGLPVPRFRIVIREDGTGSYEGDEVASGAGGGGDTARGQQTAHVERKMNVSAANTAKIFKTARSEKFFNVTCASKAKNIADTGAKTLSYAGPDGKGMCAYNYTENKGVAMLTELFAGIATTLDEGRKLEFKHRYDHLGLDAELDILTQANEGGRAVELGTIAPLLHQLVDDTELMQRVRLRAAKLLDRAADGR